MGDRESWYKSKKKEDIFSDSEMNKTCRKSLVIKGNYMRYRVIIPVTCQIAR